MIEIKESPVDSETLAVYSRIPISFQGSSRFIPRSKSEGWRLDEQPAELFFKDYDKIDNPLRWANVFDTSNWVMLRADRETTRTGGAVLVFDTAGVDMLEARSDLCVLWDLRVLPDYRNEGIGTQLIERALQVSQSRGCKEIKVETQDVNVAACRFYHKMGFRLRTVRPGAYPELPDEVQLLWYREL